MIILGTLFPEDREKEILSTSNESIANAANSFQWELIKGIQDNTDEQIVIVNVLPVGTWPKHYKAFILKDSTWSCEDAECYEIGGINLPVIKQLTRMQKIRHILVRYSEENEILLFTAYLPFLWATYKLNAHRKVTAVITDIPEFYDLHHVSAIRKGIRMIHNKLVYHFMKRVDKFVLLTEQMKVPLHIGGKPYMVMEGIVDIHSDAPKKQSSAFAMLYSGRLNKRYGLGALLDAVDNIDDPDIELWICGAGEMESEIRKKSQKDSRIKFFGFVTHEEALLLQQQATVLVNPRFNDGEYTKYSFPSKTMEYLAAGKPVMMFHLDGIPREYDPFLIYIPEENVDSIKKTILELKDAPRNELIEIGQRGRNFVQSKKNRTVQAYRMLSFIRGEQEDAL